MMGAGGHVWNIDMVPEAYIQIHHVKLDVSEITGSKPNLITQKCIKVKCYQTWSHTT